MDPSGLKTTRGTKITLSHKIKQEKNIYKVKNITPLRYIERETSSEIVHTKVLYLHFSVFYCAL